MEGEDLEIIKIFKNKREGFYVDAGCYHPVHLNNTFLLFKKKWSGINIDISQFSIDLFNHLRPKDININSAVANSDGEKVFYFQKKLSQLSTTNKKIALERMQGKIYEKKIKCQKLSTILNGTKYKNRPIDFLNIDIEGADYKALISLDFKSYKPKVICIEINEKNVINSETYKYLIKIGYKKIWSSKSNWSHIFTN